MVIISKCGWLQLKPMLLFAEKTISLFLTAPLSSTSANANATTIAQQLYGTAGQQSTATTTLHKLLQWQSERIERQHRSAVAITAIDQQQQQQLLSHHNKSATRKQQSEARKTGRRTKFVSPVSFASESSSFQCPTTGTACIRTTSRYSSTVSYTHLTLPTIYSV